MICRAMYAKFQGFNKIPIDYLRFQILLSNEGSKSIHVSIDAAMLFQSLNLA